MKTKPRFHYRFERTIDGLSPLKVMGKKMLYVDKCQDGTWIAFLLRDKNDVDEAKKKLKEGGGYSRPDIAVFYLEHKGGKRVHHPRAVPVTIDGVSYESIKQAERAFGWKRGYLSTQRRQDLIMRKKEVTSEELQVKTVYRSLSKKVWVDGVEYPSLGSCARHFGIKECYFREIVGKLKTDTISMDVIEKLQRGKLKPFVFDGKTYSHCKKLASELGVNVSWLAKAIRCNGCTSSKDLEMSGKRFFYNNKTFFVRSKVSISYVDAIKVAKNLRSKDWISFAEIENMYAGSRVATLKKSERIRKAMGHDIFSNYLSREKVEQYTFLIDAEPVRDGYCSISTAVSLRISEFQGFFSKVDASRKKILTDKSLINRLTGIIRREFGGELLPYQKEVPFLNSEKRKVMVYPLDKIDEYIDILKRRGVYCLQRKKISVDTVSMSASHRVQNYLYGNSSAGY